MEISSSNREISDLIHKADRAAAARRYNEALALLDQVVALGSPDLDTLLKAASLRRANDEPRKALELVDAALAKEPLHFLALFMRAGILEQLGDPSAPEAYGCALAQRSSNELPAPLAAAVQRAEQLYADYIKASKVHLESILEPLGREASGLELKRLKRFATNMARQTHVHHSEPTHFHFPGLPEYEFHDRSFFPWLDQLEGATTTIRQEFESLLASERSALVPYVQYGDKVPMRQWKDLNHNLDWTAAHLLQRGVPVQENARHCPKTMELLSLLPQPELPDDAPNAMFSLLKPHTHIPPHHGVASFRLVCHLPLIVPPNCWFRVGAERREWVEGEAFVFDDTIEHEAANESDQLRVVLIFDVWHPGLSLFERQAIRALLAANPQQRGLL